MALSGKVLEQDRVSSTEPPHRPIADPYLHLSAGHENSVLAARSSVPIGETAVAGAAKCDRTGLIHLSRSYRL